MTILTGLIGLIILSIVYILGFKEGSDFKTKEIQKERKKSTRVQESIEMKTIMYIDATDFPLVRVIKLLPSLDEDIDRWEVKSFVDKKEDNT